MSAARPKPTGVERRLKPGEVIVSRTDLRGLITECNDVFVETSGYGAAELFGAPHSLVRHPDMPRALFKHLWQELYGGREAFVFVKNLAKDGGHYWVIAQVLPELVNGVPVGYLSFRRCPGRRGVAVFETLYERMRDEERRLGGDEGMEAAFQLLKGVLSQLGRHYDELVYEVPTP